MRQAANNMYERGEFNSKLRDEYIKKNTKKAINIRTIQRHLKEDKRIHRKGRYYYIDSSARFEVRYLKPDIFGRDIFREFRFKLEDNSSQDGLEKNIVEYIVGYGAFIFFTFIEAVRPFKDPSMSQFERNELATYWARNAVPIERMFERFHISFNHNFENKSTLPNKEFTNDNIRRLLKSFKKLYPEIYERLCEGRKISPWYPGSEDIPRSLHVHGKSLEKLPTKSRIT